MGVNVVPWHAERVFTARHVLLNISESHVWDSHIIRNLARHNFRSSRIKPNPIRFSFSECISLVSSKTCALFQHGTVCLDRYSVNFSSNTCTHVRPSAGLGEIRIKRKIYHQERWSTELSSPNRPTSSSFRTDF